MSDLSASVSPERTFTDDEALALAEYRDLARLMRAAAARRDDAHGSVVSYSRKVFVPLTQLCRDVCHYCTFAQAPDGDTPPYLTIDAVLEIARAGKAAVRFSAGMKGCSRAMAKFAVIVTFGDKSKRDEVRPTHRVYLQELLANGKLHESGPFVDDDGALIIYECGSLDEAKELFAADPYSGKEGVVGAVQIREWNRLFAAQP